jgi:hypothetical protein
MTNTTNDKTRKTIGIVVICTNAYFILGLRFVKKFLYYYTGQNNVIFYLFTDQDPAPYLKNIQYKYIHNEHTRWVDGTNSKFANIISLEHESCDYLFYFDADTNIGRPFDESWFIGDLVAGEHYNNRSYAEDVEKKPFERNPKSKACVPVNSDREQVYCYGAFFGGKTDMVVSMCKTLRENQLADQSIKFEPCWNDESYLNHYFHYNSVTIIPSNEFMFGVSDKGGVGETRNTKLDILDYIQQLNECPNKPFEIINKKLVFID